MPGTIQGFPPIANRRARVLVLGSMPSAASLAAGQYYAHPQNQFWRIMGAICDLDARASYAQRQASLGKAGIALWDVVASCRREGSLDSAIVEQSIRVNDFAAFLDSHPAIVRICFNGRRAESAWKRNVARHLTTARKLEFRLLPSTSPAHAGMSYLRKLRAWESAIRC